MASSKPSLAPVGGSCKSALLVAEELAFDQVLRDRGAIDLDIGFVAPRAVAVEFPRDHLFAGSAFARDQDGGIGRGNPLDDLAHPVNCRTPADDLSGRAFPFAEVPVDLDQLAVRLRLLQDNFDLAGREGLDQVVKSAGPHAGHGAFNRAVAGDDDDRRPLWQQADPLQELKAVAIGQAHIHEHQVERFVRDKVLRVRQATGHDHAVILAAKDLAQDIPDDQFIVQNQDLFERHDRR